MLDGLAKLYQYTDTLTRFARMDISISLSDGVPIWRQIFNQIKYLMASGLLRPGEELPPIRTLAYGKRIAIGGISCAAISKAVGVRCENASALGFSLSTKGWQPAASLES